MTRPLLVVAVAVSAPACSSFTVAPVAEPALDGLIVTFVTSESLATSPSRATSRTTEPRSSRPTATSRCSAPDGPMSGELSDPQAERTVAASAATVARMSAEALKLLCSKCF